MPGRFADIDRPQDVIAGVKLRFRSRNTDIYLSGKMKDHIRIAARHDVSQLRCLNIGLHKSEPGSAGNIAMECTLKVRENTSGEVVYSDDLVAILKQAINQG